MKPHSPVSVVSGITVEALHLVLSEVSVRTSDHGVGHWL